MSLRVARTSPPSVKTGAKRPAKKNLSNNLLQPLLRVQRCAMFLCVLCENGQMKVLDVGCGPGIYVRALNEQGIDARGVDLDRRTPCQCLDVFSEAFLAEHGDHKYDLCISLEVAEHLPEVKADAFVSRLVQVAPTILFSAAQPGQGGAGHINCQPVDYWVEKFAAYNYVLDQTATRLIRDHMASGYHMGWFVRNALVFKSFGEHSFETIIREETPQAVRLAQYLASHTL